MPEQSLTIDQIIAKARAEGDEQKADYFAALAAAEDAWAEHEAAQAEAKQLLELYQRARERAERAGARLTEALTRQRACGEALPRIDPAPTITSPNTQSTNGSQP